MNTAEDKKVEALIRAAEKVYPSTKTLIWRSFLHGLFVALGTTVGLSIVFAVLTFIIAQLKLIPLLRDFVNTIKIEEVIPTSYPRKVN